jgi:hypothetical protein
LYLLIVELWVVVQVEEVLVHKVRRVIKVKLGELGHVVMFRALPGQLAVELVLRVLQVSLE